MHRSPALSQSASLAARRVGAAQSQRNPQWLGYRCLRCEQRYDLGDLPEGCPACARAGVPASVVARYANDPADAADASNLPTQARWPQLPYQQPWSLGEGHTPCVAVPALAAALGLARVSIKNESANPTGSHKDRMSAMGITHALQQGAHTVVLASSGNAAISAAAYCAAAGLACEVAAYSTLADPFARGLAAFGAQVLSFDTPFARWDHVRQRAQSPGVFALTNYMVPPVGSAAVAVEAYKAIAWECVDAGVVPDHVLVPTARGDLLWGIWAGFEHARAAGRIARTPRVWAIEPFARLSRVLSGEPLSKSFEGSTAQFSIAGETVTYQQWHAVQRSEGGAVVVDDALACAAQRSLGAHGFWPELCAAAPLAAMQILLHEGRIQPSEHALLIMTARADRDNAAPSFRAPSSSLERNSA
ncbi:MAG TPA: pyridoxal-phosphate dependent enzyme [Burkholderiaceae bacterium]|nr:pyridoxal-phosphate dependent enzyme [Burkholderiaceae bacterium]